ncbi:hypothetical protein OEZ85_002889 [Tetradesmus obliquus]|uniref:RNase H type-1 domain-containing protein n=1 Tax=Tetradesmus obliquus TaxID=3088 RepID=A0ABY8TZE3_TETOB|nr:hypothetical protein OEZ85_002889 [Tetradesmus obliquus]
MQLDISVDLLGPGGDNNGIYPFCLEQLRDILLIRQIYTAYFEEGLTVKEIMDIYSLNCNSLYPEDRTGAGVDPALPAAGLTNIPNSVTMAVSAGLDLLCGCEPNFIVTEAASMLDVARARYAGAHPALAGVIDAVARSLTMCNLGRNIRYVFVDKKRLVAQGQELRGIGLNLA